MSAVADRRGFAPPITGRFAAEEEERRRPRRLHRTRRAKRATPTGVVYVGRPTIWSNPFSGRNGIGQARSVILYRAWVLGDCTPRVLRAAGFSAAEAGALARWRTRLLERLPGLAGRDLQCWCPLTSSWCHAETLLRLANEPIP